MSRFLTPLLLVCLLLCAACSGGIDFQEAAESAGGGTTGTGNGGACAISSDWTTIYACDSSALAGQQDSIFYGYYNYNFLSNMLAEEAHALTQDQVNCIAQQECLSALQDPVREPSDCIRDETFDLSGAICGYDAGSLFGYDGSGGDGDGGAEDGGIGLDAEICNDGIDNDGDEAIDCADFGCTLSSACVPPDLDYSTGDWEEIPESPPADPDVQEALRAAYVAETFEEVDTDGYQSLVDMANACEGNLLKGYERVWGIQYLVMTGDVGDGATGVCRAVFDLYHGDDQPSDYLQLHVYTVSGTAFIEPAIPYADLSGTLEFFRARPEDDGMSLAETLFTDVEEYADVPAAVYNKDDGTRSNIKLFTAGGVAAGDGYNSVSSWMSIGRIKPARTRNGDPPYHYMINIFLVKPLDGSGGEIGGETYCQPAVPPWGNLTNQPYMMTWVITGDCLTW